MSHPRTAQVEVELIPVACDIIAEYGQLLEARRTPDGLVVIGVYTPLATGDTLPAKATITNASGIEFYPQSKAKAPKNGPKPPKIADSLILELIDGMDGMVTASRLTTAVRMRIKDNIPPYVVRDRLAVLVRHGHVIVFKSHASPYKCYRVAHQGNGDTEAPPAAEAAA